MSLRRSLSRLFSTTATRSCRPRPARKFRAPEQLERRELLATVYGDFNADGYDDLAIGAPGEAIGSIANAGAVNVIYGSFLAMQEAGDQIWHQPGAGSVGSGELQGAAEDGDKFGSALASGDFDNDGYMDLAIGIPGEDIGPITEAGAVAILYGSSSGLGTSRNAIFSQDSRGIEDQAERYDRFGSALTTGDFNADGYADLAIGSPGENIGDINNAGAVHILFGSSLGLNSFFSRASQFWHQDSVAGGAIADDAERYDNFGAALVAADFDGDGADDLAVGVPGEDNGDTLDAGAVNVLFGDAGVGLVASGNRFFNQNSVSPFGSDAVEDTSEAFDYFGAALAAGDFNDDGRADLAIGVPGEDIGSLIDAGGVNVLYGHATDGLTIAGDQFWSQNSTSIEGVSEANDLFGSALAAGDFNGDGRDDLAIGSPGEDVGSIKDAGAVNLIYSQSGGKLGATGDKIFDQNSVGITDAVAETNNAFGSSLAAGHGNYGVFADLAVATPGQKVGGKDDAGAVYTLFGKSGGGFAESLNQIWHQNSINIEGTSETGDLFGGAKPIGLRTDGLLIPVLNSNPGAPRSLYIDLNGHYQSNWDGDTEDTQTPAFDMDGQPDYFNPTELQIIEDMWEHAAEDYAPFNVNVTTVYPGAMTDGLNQRIAVGGRFEDWYNNPSTGVAYVGAFKNSSLPNVGYVFSQNIFDAFSAGDDVASKIGSTISHEAGHTFGLQHKGDVGKDGKLIDPKDEYSEGGADWTPIMGNNLQTDRVIWMEPKVEVTPGSVWAQGSDDIKVLTGTLGARADDHSRYLSSATPLGTLNSANSMLVDTGIIETKGDVDTFTFQVDMAGTLTIQLLVNDVGANLDSRIGFGPVSYTYSYLAESNPSDSLNATITFNVQPGEFYVDVASVKQFVGDVGQYTLRVELATAPLVLTFPIILSPVRTDAPVRLVQSASKESGGDQKTLPSTETLQKSSGIAPETTETELLAKRSSGRSSESRASAHPDSASAVRMRLLALDAVFASPGR